MRRLHVAALALLVVLAGCAGGTVPGGGTGDGDTSTPTTARTTVETGGGTMTVHFINVGQSVSTLVVGPTGETMLVDTGDFTDDGEYVLEYLQRHDVDRIDHLVTSHGDADHIGGHAAVIDYYETEADGIGAIYDPGIASSTQTYGAYLDAVERHDVDLFRTQVGDDIPFEGVDVQVLGPPTEPLAGEDRNENSIVLKLSYGETSFLLTGDAEREEEAYLVERYGDRLSATVLKAGHHGSSSSTGDGLLDAVAPARVIVSSAYDSRYGHPHDETLARLAARGVPTYWTGTHGDVVLRTDGQRLTVATQYVAPTDPERLRNGDPATPGADVDVSVRETLAGGAAVTTTAGETATDGGDGGELSLVEFQYDAPGDDRENANEEFLVLANTGDAPIDLSGWTVRDAAGHRYTFESLTLAPGERVTLHSGSGTDDEDDRYWGEGALWNNDGDTLIVETATGQRVIEETYP